MQTKDQIYKKTQVSTSNSISMLIMLYDKAIQNLEIAKELLKNEILENIINANEKICHSQEIISELMATLNFEHGGNISVNLFSIYSFLNKELDSVVLKKEINKIDNVLKQLKALNSAWKKLSKKENKHNSKLGINIVS